MTTRRHELEAWLGPALDELTPEQVDQLHRESDRIGERYPDPDDQDLRDAALSAATQYLLGETSIDDVGRELTEIRLREARAYAAAYQIATLAAEAGMPEAEVARRVGIDRMTVRRKILGKQ